ncbi:unnamed protein product, partial [marine sediment metagenome]
MGRRTRPRISLINVRITPSLKDIIESNQKEMERKV